MDVTVADQKNNQPSVYTGFPRSQSDKKTTSRWQSAINVSGKNWFYYTSLISRSITRTYSMTTQRVSDQARVRETDSELFCTIQHHYKTLIKLTHAFQRLSALCRIFTAYNSLISIFQSLRRTFSDFVLLISRHLICLITHNMSWMWKKKS